MPVVVVSPALRERLGEDGATDLVRLLNSASEDRFSLSEEKFERRLVEEIGKVNARILNFSVAIIGLLVGISVKLFAN